MPQPPTAARRRPKPGNFSPSVREAVCCEKMLVIVMYRCTGYAVAGLRSAATAHAIMREFTWEGGLSSLAADPAAF
jgi:hypothetical protein